MVRRPRAGNFILNNADLIVTLADSLSFRQIGFDQSLFAPNATFVMVDVDDDEVKKPGLNISTYIKSDIKEFFKKWKTEGVSVSASDEWMDYCRGSTLRLIRLRVVLAILTARGFLNIASGRNMIDWPLTMQSWPLEITPLLCEAPSW